MPWVFYVAVFTITSIVSSQNENERGLAHFLEHLAFKGTSSFDTGELIKTLEKIGIQYGQHLNASTGQEHTTYKLTVPLGDDSPRDRVELALRV